VKVLFILNDAPYGSERLFNGLRLAVSLSKREDVALRHFLIGDAASGAKAGQKAPSGCYNIERMLESLTGRGAEVGACGSCLDARGLAEGPFAEGVKRSTMEELTDWVVEADKVAVF
jgi:uncharacterized protein involved in oxidation of intracellular sulfur